MPCAMPAKKPAKSKPPMDPVIRRMIAHRFRLDMSQEEYAAEYGFNVGTIRKWEQQVSEPDPTAKALLSLWLLSENA